MLRTTTTRPILKGLFKVSSTRSSYNIASSSINATVKTRSLGSRRARAIISTFLRPGPTSVFRYATTAKPPFDKIDTNAERKILEQQLQADPESVSAGSSVRHVFEGGRRKGDDDADMLAGIKNDIVGPLF
jgi:hypothetical protein